MKARTLTQAYADAGFRIANPRNHWSALDEEREAVAVTVWDDQIDRSQEPWHLDTSIGRPIEDWGDRIGNKVRRRHLRYALDHCNGRVSLILITAVDVDEEPRRIAQREHLRDRIGILREPDFDEASGSFRLEIVRL